MLDLHPHLFSLRAAGIDVCALVCRSPVNGDRPVRQRRDDLREVQFQFPGIQGKKVRQSQELLPVPLLHLDRHNDGPHGAHGDQGHPEPVGDSSRDASSPDQEEGKKVSPSVLPALMSGHVGRHESAALTAP
ncbi:hypothetical protein GCM10008949_50730 [Deinococcus humi]|nr:hypothetical protein GCM10008949_50730 [Deinococcus humi]